MEDNFLDSMLDGSSLNIIKYFLILNEWLKRLNMTVDREMLLQTQASIPSIGGNYFSYIFLGVQE